MSCFIDDTKGQASVEAAIMIPLLFMLVGLLCQPAILLYNRCVMQQAAAESCRMVATGTADDAAVYGFVERRLSAIPAVDAFHRGGNEGWDIDYESSDGSAMVHIINRAQPLPLFGIVAGLGGTINSSGELVQEVEASCCIRPEWARASGQGPADWVGKWN